MATDLSTRLRALGVNWDYQVGMRYAPPASALVGRPWAMIRNQPSLYQLLLAAAEASGKPQADYLAEQRLFTPTAPAYNQVYYRY